METYQDIKEIVLTGEHIGDIKYKPAAPMYIMIVVAVALLFVPLIAARILAIFIIAVDALVYFKIEDSIVINVYSDCILIHHPTKQDSVFKVLNSDIEQYDLGVTEPYNLTITLYDGRMLRKETYRMDQARKYLKIALPKKTLQEVRQKKNKDIKLDPVKGFKKLFGIKTKKKGEDK